MVSAVPRNDRIALTTTVLLAASCSGGTGGVPLSSGNAPVEIAFCRHQPEQSTRAEIALRSGTNLGTLRVLDRPGIEMHVRVHPAADRVVFARERRPGDPSSREIFRGGLTSSVDERRLTLDTAVDDSPCWSPGGDRVLFSSDRSGERRLWHVAEDGTDLREMLSAATGISDTDPDWFGPTDRIVFSRRQAGSARIWAMQGNGTGLVPISLGAPSPTEDEGDRWPCFQPGGQRVTFVRNSAGFARLIEVDLTTGHESEIWSTAAGGALRHPRYTPTADRILMAWSEPTADRSGLRLAMLTPGSAEPRLVEPGEQWSISGVDTMPDMPAFRTEVAPVVVPVTAAEVQVSSGLVLQGNRTQLVDIDQQPLILATSSFQTHEIASLNVVFDLPGDPFDIVAIRAAATWRVSRADGDTTLRLAMHNPVDGRYDTVAERPVSSTDWQSLGFTSQSLAHVSRSGQARIHVIAEIGQGARAEVHVDQVRLEVVTTAPATERR
jgi:hypothetical protein